MNKTPTKYEGDITLKRFFRALKRNLLTIICFFLMFTAAGFAFVKVTSNTKYSSTGYVSMTKNISGSSYQNLPNVILNDRTITAAVETLKENKIYHSNGSFISYEEITAGLSAVALDTLKVRCVYVNADHLVTKEILDTVMKEAVELGNSDAAYEVLYAKSLIVLNEASAATKVASKKSMTLVLFAAVGLALGVAGAIIRENARDTVYSENDFDELGVVMFPLKYKNDSKFLNGFSFTNKTKIVLNEATDATLKASFETAQNNLSIYSRKHPIQTVAVAAPRKLEEFDLFVKAFVDTYAKESTLVIDLNMREPLLDKLLPTEHKTNLSQLIDKNLTLDDLAVHVKDNLDAIYIDHIDYLDKVLCSAAFTNLMTKAREKYNHIVFVSPAWMKYQDLALVRKHLDAILLFSVKNKTRRDDIVKSIETFDLLKLPYVGTTFIK